MTMDIAAVRDATTIRIAVAQEPAPRITARNPG